MLKRTLPRRGNYDLLRFLIYDLHNVCILCAPLPPCLPLEGQAEEGWQKNLESSYSGSLPNNRRRTKILMGRMKWQLMTWNKSFAKVLCRWIPRLFFTAFYAPIISTVIQRKPWGGAYSFKSKSNPMKIHTKHSNYSLFIVLSRFAQAVLSQSSSVSSVILLFPSIMGKSLTWIHILGVARTSYTFSTFYLCRLSSLEVNPNFWYCLMQCPC